MSSNDLPFIDLKTQYRALQSSIRGRIEAVLEHGQYIMGPEVRELEAALQAFSGAKHCVTTSSGTDALLISLMALGIGPGDEVVTTAFSFAATAEVILLVGATPVFVDIDPETCNIDPALIEAEVTERTKAILPVSLYGQTAQMDDINDIARRHGLHVIEDAAQSFGAAYNGRKSTRLSTIGCTSFFPSKPLGCYGDGGALFTDDDNLAQICREIRVHGQSRRYIHTRLGLGGRMDTLQCAIVLAKLERFEWEIGRRAAIGARYNDLFDNAGVTRVKLRDGHTSVYAQYTLKLDKRETVVEKLSAAGVPTAIHYPLPLNRQPAYRDGARGHQTPHADTASSQVVSLPMHSELSVIAQNRIVAAVIDAMDGS